jgi:hypothetical protein
LTSAVGRNCAQRVVDERHRPYERLVVCREDDGDRHPAGLSAGGTGRGGVWVWRGLVERVGR